MEKAQTNKNKQTGRKTQLGDIADALGISKATVSRAISGKGRVSAETRQKVSACIKELNYRPNMIAKSLSENKTYNIGIVIPMDNMESEAPFFQTCLMGITRRCAMRNYDTLAIGTDRNDYSQLRRVVRNGKVDGIIITRPLADGIMEKILTEENIPYVVIGRSEEKNAYTVDSDHRRGCCELTSYLLMNNPPESIALFIGSMEQTVNRSRYDGFCDAFAASEIQPQRDMIFKGAETPIQIKNIVSELISKTPRCVICGDDMLCVKLLSELSQEGKSIPDDMRVASFYDSIYLDSYSPPITSLRFSAGEIGTEAATVLLDILSGISAEKNTSLGFEMLVRSSTL